MRGCAGKFVGQFAVIGEEQQSFRGIVQPSYGINALTDISDQVHDRRTALRICYRGYIALGFVEQQVDVALLAAQQLAIYFDVIALEVGLAAKFSNSLAVHRYPPLRDQLLGLSSRGYAGCGDDLL